MLDLQPLEHETLTAVRRTQEVLQTAFPGRPHHDLGVTLDNVCARLLIACTDDERIAEVHRTLTHLQSLGVVERIGSSQAISTWIPALPKNT